MTTKLDSSFNSEMGNNFNYSAGRSFLSIRHYETLEIWESYTSRFQESKSNILIKFYGVLNCKTNILLFQSLVGIEKLSWQRGNRSILVAFDKNSAPGQEGQIVEIDHDEKTSKIEAWSTGSDLTGDKVTPKNPRFTNLDGAQKMKLEKAVQHRNVYTKNKV